MISKRFCVSVLKNCWLPKQRRLSTGMAFASAPRTKLHFSVDVGVLRPWEYVFVSGSTPPLGQWNPCKAFQLLRCPESPERWSGVLEVGSEPVQFRYFIGYYLDPGKEGSQKELLISKWESFLHPRIILPAVETIGGSCRAHVVDTFGLNAGKQLISEGWLLGENQNEILLRIHGTAFKFYSKRHAQRSYRIKVTPFDLRHKEDGSLDDDDADDNQDNFQLPPLPSFSTAHIAVLSGEEPCYREQRPCGERFKVDTDYFVFRVRSVAVEFLGFRIELFVHRTDSEDCGERFAISYALPAALPGTFGMFSLPLLAKSNRPVGEICVDYMFIRVLKKPHPPQTMAVSYVKHWKKRKTLEVGHRGMGMSYTKMAAGRENTIHSLNSAARNGADYVEFDVQLTKDKVPIIFHDFQVLVSVAKRHSSRLDAKVDFHEMNVKDLKLKQLQLLRLDHYMANSQTGKNQFLKVSEDPDEAAERSPFPVLVDALRQVDPSVGFNVEVKYPMMQKNGVHECENYFEHNEYIDLILSDVLTYANDRRIVFSSFDPDTCALIAAKQNKYPVLFLCVGETTRYEPFADMRSSTSYAAVNFAASIGILGVNFHSEDLLRDPSPVKRANKFGLVSFVWGDDLDSKKNIDYFRKELLVDGIIYDRIGEIEARRNVFVVEREAKTALFRNSVSPSSSRHTVSLDECPSSSSESSSSSTTTSPSRSPECNHVHNHD